MALKAQHHEVTFGVGDKIRVRQKGSTFEGMVIGIKGRGTGKTFTVRRIGEAQIGIEKIFPLGLPSIQKIEVVKKGLRGVRRSKLYFIREKSTSEIDMIFRRAAAKAKTKKLKLTKTSKSSEK